MSNPWFRLYVEFANDPKIQMMSEAMQRRYVMLLCLRASGDLQKLDDESIAWSLRISVADLLETKALFISSRLIRDGWTIVDWPQHKPGSDRPQAHIWRAIRERIFARDDYTCQYCRKRGGRLECDHVMPVAKGGDHGDANLKTACLDVIGPSGTKHLMNGWREMDFLTVKNWDRFQHYGKPNPPWIKMHRALLDDYNFCSLPDISKAHLLLLWLYASQNAGRIPVDIPFLERKLSCQGLDLNVIVAAGFLEPEPQKKIALARA